jgi:hypothetical protein
MELDSRERFEHSWNLIPEFQDVTGEPIQIDEYIFKIENNSDVKYMFVEENETILTVWFSIQPQTYIMTAIEGNYEKLFQLIYAVLIDQKNIMPYQNIRAWFPIEVDNFWKEIFSSDVIVSAYSVNLPGGTHSLITEVPTNDMQIVFSGSKKNYAETKSCFSLRNTREIGGML